MAVRRLRTSLVEHVHVHDKRLDAKAELQSNSGGHHQQSPRSFTISHSRDSFFSGLVQMQISRSHFPLGYLWTPSLAHFGAKQYFLLTPDHQTFANPSSHTQFDLSLVLRSDC